MATHLYEAGAVDATTMKEFDALCAPKTHALSPSRIKHIRQTTGVSQAVLAKLINVSLAAVKQWERGERTPSGAALKLLNLIEAKGLEVVL